MQYKLTKSESIIISLNQTSTMSALMKWIFSAFFFVILGFAGCGYLVYKEYLTFKKERVLLILTFNCIWQKENKTNLDKFIFVNSLERSYFIPYRRSLFRPRTRCTAIARSTYYATTTKNKWKKDYWCFLRENSIAANERQLFLWKEFWSGRNKSWKLYRI